MFKTGTTMASETRTAVVATVKTPTITAPALISIGYQTTLTGSGSPDAINPWTSSDSNTLSINNSGLITGVATGSATVTYTDSIGCQTTAIINVAQFSLGNYTDQNITYPGGHVTVTPDATPAGTPGITVTTTAKFKGLFTVDHTTGVINITNAYPAGTYIIKVNGGSDVIKTFTLTVGNAPCSQGKFYAPTVSELAAASVDMVTADFNGDGNLDLALLNTYINTLSIQLGDGAGGFSEHVSITTGLFTRQLALADFNGDGKSDLVIVSGYDNNLSQFSILIGDGLGGFTTASTVQVPLAPMIVATADINGDGLSDLAFSQGDNISIRLGNGTGGFTGSTEIPVSTPSALAFGDFNGDGKIDLAVTSTYDTTIPGIVTIKLGDGSGGFSGTNTFPVGINPVRLVISDFNSDGYLDLATANSGSNDLSILLGNGSGSFTPGSSVSVGASPISLSSGDFNGDGKIDLAVVNSGDNNSSVLLGNGLGGFSNNGIVPIANYSTAIISADFNNDGRLDFAIGGATASIRLNGTVTINLQGNSTNITNGSTTISSSDGTDFGSGNDITHIFTIHNNGSGGLTIDSLFVIGTDTASFRVSGITLPKTISGNDTAHFVLTLKSNST